MKIPLLAIVLLSLLGSGNPPQVHSAASASPAYNPRSLAWDLSQPQKYMYKCHQTFTRKDVVRGLGTVYHEGEGDGVLEVHTRTDSLTMVGLVDLTMKVRTTSTFDSEEKIDTKQMSDIWNLDLKPDGTFADPDANVLYRSICYLPRSPLPIGKLQKVRMEGPLNRMEYPLVLQGINTLTCLGYHTFKGRNCAVWTTHLNFATNPKTKALAKEYEGTLKGMILHFFDFERGRLHAVYIRVAATVDYEGSSGMALENSSDETYEIHFDKIEE